MGSMWRNAMRYLGLAPDDEFEEYDDEPERQAGPQSRGACPHCRQQIASDDNFCMHCGVQLVSHVRRCNKCGAYPDPRDRFCILCGEGLHTGAAT